jgi:predicted DNA-binding protein with PD1-like motif
MKQITFRLKPGQFLKEEIEKTAQEKNISAGVLLSVVGGLKLAVLRMAGAKPDDQPIKKWDGPLEIVSGTGTVSKEGSHLHISISDQTGNVFGGHLKDGCEVHPTAEVVIGIFDDVSYNRVLDENTGFKELTIE